jgi:hypothetical protein
MASFKAYRTAADPVEFPRTPPYLATDQLLIICCRLSTPALAMSRLALSMSGSWSSHSARASPAAGSDITSGSRISKCSACSGAALSKKYSGNSTRGHWPQKYSFGQAADSGTITGFGRTRAPIVFKSAVFGRATRLCRMSLQIATVSPPAGPCAGEGSARRAAPGSGARG